MEVQVFGVNIPGSSTVGTATGYDIATGDTVVFAGDHRALRDIGEAISSAEDRDDLPVADVEDYQILSWKESEHGNEAEVD